MTVPTRTRTLATEAGVRAWDAEVEARAGGDPGLIHQMKVQRLRDEVQKGFDSADQGRYTIISNDQELEEFMADCGRRAHERVQRRCEQE